MTGPRNLKFILILAVLALSLAIAAEAHADVTSAPPADTGTLPTTVTATGTSTSTTPPGATPPSTTPPSTGAPNSGTSPGGSDPAPVSTDPAPVSTDPTDPAPVSSSDPAPQDQGPSPPTGDDQPTTTADGPSTSTSQTIVQVQTSGCLAHCQGTSQTQSAQQQNLTVQGPPPETASGGSTGQTTAGPQPHGSANVTQIQVGCIHDCSGTSLDTTAPQISPGTLSQLLAVVESQSPPDQPPGPPGAQSTVEQTSLQIQQGDASGEDQLQAASQLSATVQDLVSQAVDEAVAAVNQTTQTIVQVQIGCLFYCTDTHQTQQASQSNTAVQVVAQGVAAATAPAATVVSIVDQLVLQLQIGCIAWCSDTTQEQSASQSNEVVVTTWPQAPNPPAAPPDDPAPAAGSGDPGPAPAPAAPSPVPIDPGPASASPSVLAPKPSPAVVDGAPPAVVVTTPWGRPSAQWASETGVAEHQPSPRAPIGLAPEVRRPVATTVVPVASSADTPTETHREAPIARLISSGSWRVERLPTAPATASSSGAAPTRDDIIAIEVVLATFAAFALGLVLCTAVRLRTR